MIPKIKLSVWWLLSVALLLAPVSNGWSETIDWGECSTAVPRFEKTVCKHKLAANSTTKCGYLVVPEDHGNPSGKTIKVYAAIYKNPTSPTTEPVFYLIGGPGATTADAYNIFEDSSPGNYIRNNFGDHRDIVVMDQRGSNNSSPGLYCSEELGPLRSQVYGISYRDAAALRIQAFSKCYNRFKNAGIDLSEYNTLENAADIKDLAAALGYSKINLYTASYGTRLGMVMMRHFPKVIKSVVLDSILPPEINPFEQETPGTLYSFRSFFDAAKSQFPLLEANFYTMVNELEKNPVPVIGHHYSQISLTGEADASNRFMSSNLRRLLFHRYDHSDQPTDNIQVNVSGDKLVAFLVQELKQTPYDTQLPQKLNHMFTTKDYGAVADSWISLMDFFFPNGGPGSESPSVGMYNCIFAAQDSFYTSPNRILEIIHQKVSNKSIASWLETNFIYMEPGIMGKWPLAPLPFHQGDPIVSSIPTLMLVGSLDNATPAIFSRPSSEFLSKKYYYSIVAGHATAYLECVDQMLNRFLKNPLVNPGSSCATEYQWAD